MDILLIDPPYKSLKNIGVDCGYVLSLTSLSAYLNDAGLDTAVLTCDLLLGLGAGNIMDMDMGIYARGQEHYEHALADDSHDVWIKISDIIQRSQPKAVGLTYLTPTKNVIEKLTRLVKEIDSTIKVIAGGHHATFCPSDVMKNPHVDFVVRGEGEIPLLRLMETIRSDTTNWSDVPGIAYRNASGEVVSTEEAPMVEDLDSLPFPARDLVMDCDYNIYKTHYVLTARGCPHRCAFCSDRRMWRRRVRRRSVANVISELKLLKDTYRPLFIDFSDGTFTFDKAYLTEFCEHVIAEDIGLMWRCTARYDTITEDMLRLMKRSNCFGLYFGLESGSSRVLASINKGISTDQIRHVSEMVHDNGIISMASVMFGLPDEDEEDIRKTLELMRTVKADLFDINCYVPLPGTPLYDDMDETTRDAINWNKASYKSLASNFSRTLSSEQLRDYVLEAYEIADNARETFKARFFG